MVGVELSDADTDIVVEGVGVLVGVCVGVGVLESLTVGV
jgi:hypothetical protein